MTAFRVGILGATGAVGQKFIRLLDGHPWFKVAAVGASGRSAGKSYAEATDWREHAPMPEDVAALTVGECHPDAFQGVDFVFSGLDSSVADTVEPLFAAAGRSVISNTKSFRMHPDVPLVVPEVNPSHLDWVTRQSWGSAGDGNGTGGSAGLSQGGFIVTNPNCVVVPLVMALKPLQDAYGVSDVTVTSMQALSGAGYPGVSAMDILGNLIPYIPGEEDKIREEPLKILGDSTLSIRSTAVRVPVANGHTLSVHLTLGREGVTVDDIKATLSSYASPIAGMGLPSAGLHTIMLHDDPFSPRPVPHAMSHEGMPTHVGRIRQDHSGGGETQISFICMAHNTIRGAAGGAILNAEVLVAKGLLRGR
jgi:aspartate-semialdehyde dehydrogenase